MPYATVYKRHSCSDIARVGFPKLEDLCDNAAKMFKEGQILQYRVQPKKSMLEREMEWITDEMK